MTNRPIPAPPRNVSRRGGYAPISGPITEASAHAEPPAERVYTPMPVGTLSTTIEYRGRLLTISATGMTLDAFCESLTTDDDVSDTLYTISTGAQYQDQFIVIEFSHMTIDGFCNMLDKRLGRAE